MLPIPMFFQQAAAPAAAAPGGGDPGGGDPGSAIIQQMLFFIPLIAIFYFLLIRPQNQRMKKHRAMIAAIKKGDTVITQGGIIGRIFKLGDDEVTIDTGEGGKLRIVRSMIVDVKNKPDQAPANDVKEG
ncbi:MAG: preprotein translocase subunit YajC [Hyphomonadaceae bacterium]|nr:preprotein translocase subunit YajC [Hyphomonadaceae bacterium]